MKRSAQHPGAPISPERKAELEAFCLEHGRFVVQFVMRMIGPGSDVEDLAQEVLIVAMRRMEKGREHLAAPRSWLGAIAIRIVANARRTRWHQGLFGTSPLPRDFTEFETPESKAEGRERCAEFYRMIGQLTEKKQRVLLLHDIEGLTCEEIGRLMGCSPATIQSRLRHAKAELGEIFEREGKE